MGILKVECIVFPFGIRVEAIPVVAVAIICC